MCKQIIKLFIWLGGWIRAHGAQADIDSPPAELVRYTESRPREVHGVVAAAQLHMAPAKRVGVFERIIDPERPRRVAQGFSFRSPIETSYPENNTCYGVKWYGEGHQKAATAVVMTHGAFVFSLLAERVLSAPLLGRDVHVYGLVAPYHMKRAPKKSSYSGQYLLSGDIPRLIEGLIQATAEVRALVQALKQLGYRTVLLFGTSMGGNVAAESLTMTDADGGFLFIPAVDFHRLIEEAPLTSGVRRAYRAAGFTREDTEKAMEVVKPWRLGLPRCGTERVHILYGLQDRQVPSDTVERLIEAWPGVSSTAWAENHRSMAVNLLKIRQLLAEWCTTFQDDP